jgi:hypothetical protein
VLPVRAVHAYEVEDVPALPGPSGRTLRRDARGPGAGAATALDAVERSLMLLQSPRLADEPGARAVELLAAERSVDDAPEVLRRIRRLLAHYRAAGPVLPSWCERFVAQGYAHYCTLLPTAFVDEATGVRQVGAMLGSLFGTEALALSLGCRRTQLELAVRQSHPDAPAKTALLRGAQHQLGLLALPDLRARADELLGPLLVPALPQYVSGFVQALEPVPQLAPFVVETLSKAFARLPDPVLLPWLPTLIATLRAGAPDLVPLLTREAARTFPGTLAGIDSWVPPWDAPPPAPAGAGPVAADPPTSRPGALLARHPGATDGVAALLGVVGGWAASEGGAAAPSGAAAALLAARPETARAVLGLIQR